MKDTRGIIAVCGCQLFEEKEYAFISELSRQCEGGDYMVAAFNFAANSMADMDEIGKEMRLVQLMEKIECAAVIILGETINVRWRAVSMWLWIMAAASKIWSCMC